MIVKNISILMFNMRETKCAYVLKLESIHVGRLDVA